MNKEMNEIAKELYRRILLFIADKKKNDDKFYSKSYLKFGKKGTMTFSYDDYSLEINGKHFLLVIDKDGFKKYFIRTDSGVVTYKRFSEPILSRTDNELTNDQTKEMLLKLKNVCDEVKDLIYSVKQTHIFENLKDELKKEYFIRKFETTLSDCGKDILPSVEIAANWLCNEVNREEPIKGNTEPEEKLITYYNKFPVHLKYKMSAEEILNLKTNFESKVMDAFRNGLDKVIVTTSFSNNYQQNEIDLPNIVYNAGGRYKSLRDIHTVPDIEITSNSLKIKDNYLYGKSEVYDNYKEVLNIQDTKVKKYKK